MLKPLVLQVGLLLGASVAAGFVSNAVRSSLNWKGGDPELLRHEVTPISASDAAALQDDPTALFLDVRSKPDFDAEHVRGAVSFSAEDFAAGYEELRDFLEAGGQIVVYGDETLPAVRGAEFLTARGLQPQVLEGGWKAWRARGLPVEGEAAP